MPRHILHTHKHAHREVVVGWLGVLQASAIDFGRDVSELNARGWANVVGTWNSQGKSCRAQWLWGFQRASPTVEIRRHFEYIDAFSTDEFRQLPVLKEDGSQT